MRGKKGGFFSFKKMITVPFVRGLYFIVFMGINLCALVLLLNQFLFPIKMIPEIGILQRQPFYWPVLLLAVHFFWRLFCEGVVIVFRIYEMLVSIESKMTEGKMTEGKRVEEKMTAGKRIEEKLVKAKEPGPPSQKKIRSREDFKKWKKGRLVEKEMNKIKRSD